jgi:hypothetical protein
MAAVPNRRERPQQPSLYHRFSTNNEIMRPTGEALAGSCGWVRSSPPDHTGVSLGSFHSGFTANIFRIGISYWFGYWEP